MTPGNRYKQTLWRVMWKATINATVALHLAPRRAAMSKSIAPGNSHLSKAEKKGNKEIIGILEYAGAEV